MDWQGNTVKIQNKLLAFTKTWIIWFWIVCICLGFYNFCDYTQIHFKVSVTKTLTPSLKLCDGISRFE